MNIIKLDGQNSLQLLLESAMRGAVSSHNSSSTLEELIESELASKVVRITTGVLHGNDIKPLQTLYDAIKRSDTLSSNEYHLRLLKSEFFLMLLRRNNEMVELIESDDCGIYITIDDFDHEGKPVDRVVDLLDMPTDFQAIFKVGLELMATHDNLVVIEDIERLGVGDLEHFFQYLTCIVKNCNDSIYISSSDVGSIEQITKALTDQSEIEAQAQD